MKKEIVYLSILFVSCSLFISSCSKSKVDTTVSKREKAAEEMDELDVTVSSYYAQSLNGTTSANQNTYKNSSTSNSGTNTSKKTKTKDPITPSNSVEGENGSGSGVGNGGSISGADTVKIK